MSVLMASKMSQPTLFERLELGTVHVAREKIADAYPQHRDHIVRVERHGVGKLLLVPGRERAVPARGGRERFGDEDEVVRARQRRLQPRGGHGGQRSAQAVTRHHDLDFIGAVGNEIAQILEERRAVGRPRLGHVAECPRGPRAHFHAEPRHVGPVLGRIPDVVDEIANLVFEVAGIRPAKRDRVRAVGTARDIDESPFVGGRPPRQRPRPVREALRYGRQHPLKITRVWRGKLVVDVGESGQIALRLHQRHRVHPGEVLNRFFAISEATPEVEPMPKKRIAILGAGWWA